MRQDKIEVLETKIMDNLSLARQKKQGSKGYYYFVNKLQEQLELYQEITGHPYRWKGAEC